MYTNTSNSDFEPTYSVLPQIVLVVRWFLSKVQFVLHLPYKWHILELNLHSRNIEISDWCYTIVYYMLGIAYFYYLRKFASEKKMVNKW